MFFEEIGNELTRFTMNPENSNFEDMRGSRIKPNCFSAVKQSLMGLYDNHNVVKQLPDDILIELLQYLRFEELLGSVQYVNKKLHQLVNSPLLWKTLALTRTLPFHVKYRTIKCLAHRRIHGDTFQCISRLDGLNVLNKHCCFVAHCTSSI